jgi:dihydroorotate dehydrogenase
MVDGGVLSPRDALSTLEAGADLVAVGIGLVHTGPGLPKRINEAIEYEAGDMDASSPSGSAPERQAWFWGAALGLAMGIGAALAVGISLTDVLLPYDESFLGKTRAMIEAFNPRILQFMTHDRITLAGTMVSLSILYLALSLFGSRRGHHWGQRAVTVSACVGFATFFSFLGFGYLDPFHAFVAVILFQLFIQTLVLPLDIEIRTLNPPHLDNDRSWRLAQWGQLVFVCQAVGLLGAGTVILTLGMTSVFVSSDLDFLNMLPSAFHAFDPQLMPLIAHDRATFGGMLLSSGTALLLTTLWSCRAGERWLWWTYLLVLLPPYAMTLWIHFHIGYTDTIHLLPIFAGLFVTTAGLLLSAPYLLRRGGRSGSSATEAI